MATWQPPEGVQKRSAQTASAILWAMHIGGEIRSPGGQATKMLERRMRALDLWHWGAGRNFLFVATQLAKDEWGPAVEREMTPGRRCLRITLLLKPDELPPPPSGWSAKEALEKMQVLGQAEIDLAARQDVLPNAEEAWTWPSGMREQSREMARAIVWTLHDLGGVVTSTEGYAVRDLFEQIAKRTPCEPDDTTRYLLQRMYGHDDGITYYGRQILAKAGSARKCHRIELLVNEDELPRRPEGMRVPARPVKQKARVLAVKKAEPEPPSLSPPVANGQSTLNKADDQIDRQLEAAPLPPTPKPAVATPAPVEGVLDPIDLILAAQRLMTDAILQIASSVPPVAEMDPLVDDTVLRRLNETLNENQRLRRKVAEASLARDAKVKEVDIVKRALAETQANLDAVRGHVATKKNETARLMRETPRP